MQTLEHLLILGPGPSSSHTIGPYRIARRFLKDAGPASLKEARVTLFGSLALTGRGHLTDVTVRKVFESASVPVTIDFDTSTEKLDHPNTMRIDAKKKDGAEISRTFYSVGGGAYLEKGEKSSVREVYPFKKFADLREYLKDKGNDLYRAVMDFDEKDIFDYGKNLLIHSFDTIERSLNYEGILPGNLRLEAVAKKIYGKASRTDDPSERKNLYLSAYAYATAEANARGEELVTAPTCGSAGVVPAVLYDAYKEEHFSLDELTKAYLCGALVCNFIKQNASISGAVLGCQAEIGSAASFAAASLSYLHGLSLHQTEYAAEVAMEHFLGLTCDPVEGYVQIPCIERNGIASIHAYASYLYAKDISIFRSNRVDFDTVIETMKQTGSELPSDLKETSRGGLAKYVRVGK